MQPKNSLNNYRPHTLSFNNSRSGVHTMQDIKEYLSYDQETGIFTWIKAPSKKITVGNIAGTKHPAGYIQIGYIGKLYKAHRLAWWFMYNVMPICAVDHINEVRNDNRICNLRLDSNNENEQNKSGKSSNNTSGYRGVCFHKSINRWVANIRVKNTLVYLGSFKTPEEAYTSYLYAKRKHHPFWVEKQ